LIWDGMQRVPLGINLHGGNHKKRVGTSIPVPCAALVKYGCCCNSKCLVAANYEFPDTVGVDLGLISARHFSALPLDPEFDQL
jgi:hypothetical protein